MPWNVRFGSKADIALAKLHVGFVPGADSSVHVVDLKRNGKSVSVEPTLLKISDGLSLRYGKSDNGPPLVLSTQSALSSSISKRWRREAQKCRKR
jgi:hypothetical protein